MRTFIAVEIPEDLRARIAHVSEILKQGELEPMPFEKQVILFYAGTQGYFDGVPVVDISIVSTKLLDYMEKMHSKDIFDVVRESGDLLKETEDTLKQGIEEFKKIRNPNIEILNKSE